MTDNWPPISNSNEIVSKQNKTLKKIKAKTTQ